MYILHLKHSPFAFLVSLIVIIVFMFACKPTKNIVKISIQRKSTKFLVEQLRNKELNYDWFSAKLSGTAKIDDNNHSFVAKVNIRKDSVIWVSASSSLGIEVARICITKDSLKFINRLNYTYFTGSMDYLDRFILMDIDLDILQSVLTGNSFSSLLDNIPVSKEDNTKRSREDKIRSSIDDQHYLLSTLRKRKLRKTIQGKKTFPFTVHSIWLDAKTFKITSQELLEPLERQLKVRYNKFKEVENQLIPHEIIFNIKGEQSIDASLNYSKIILNKSQKLLFTIPEKYERIY